MNILWWALSVLLVVAGLIGTVLPGPGAILVFAGLSLAAWIDGFARVGAPTIVILGLCTLLSMVLDLALSAAGAKRSGASRLAVAGAGLGVLGGLFFGPAGIIIGPFVGAFAGEFLARRDVAQAGRAGAAAWIGLLLSVVLRLALAFAMIGIFAAAYLL